LRAVTLPSLICGAIIGETSFAEFVRKFIYDILSPKQRHQPHDHREHHADEQARHHRKIK
jgi:hypothetical protein